MDTPPPSREEYEALLQFQYLAPIGLVQTDMEGEISMMNPMSAQLLMPLSRDGSLSNLFTLLKPIAPDLHQLLEAFQEPQGLICDGFRIQVTAGVRGVSDPRILALTLMKLDETRLMALVGDVSLQVKRERLLQQNEAWMNAILTGITDYAVVNLDSRGRVDSWNPGVARLTGFTREALLGQSLSVFYPEDADAPHRVMDRLRDADADGWSIDDGWRARADGSRFWGSAMIAPLRERPGTRTPIPGSGGSDQDEEGAYCLIIRDITDKREATEKMRHAMTRDHLTGIANRRAFFEAGELELLRWKRSPRPLSLVLFDADEFKQVNDTWGHPAGDTVLRHLARMLLRGFRDVDVVARLGGEEFAVLLPATDLESAQGVANRVREMVAAANVEVDGHRIRYTVSGGVTAMSEELEGLDDLMKRADEALYAAKSGGRNRVETWRPPDHSKPTA